MRPKLLTFKNKNYEMWIRSFPCIICNNPSVDGHHVDHCRANCYMLVPLCVEHHTFGKEAYHVLERGIFEDTHRVNLDWIIMGFLMSYIDKLEADNVAHR